MQIPVARIRASVFALVLVAFMLPLVTVSCPGGTLSLSGAQLAFGTSIDEPQMFGPPRTRRIDSDPLAALALLTTVVGGGLALMSGAAGRTGAAVAGAAGAVLLLVLKTRVEAQVRSQAMGMMQVQFDVGYVLALLGLIAAAAASWILRSPPATAAIEHAIAASQERSHE